MLQSWKWKKLDEDKELIVVRPYVCIYCNRERVSLAFLSNVELNVCPFIGQNICCSCCIRLGLQFKECDKGRGNNG